MATVCGTPVYLKPEVMLIFKNKINKIRQIKERDFQYDDSVI